ncbi:MAG: hypothetical protein ACMUHB_07530 [Thermoplasmatota archaeon]
MRKELLVVLLSMMIWAVSAAGDSSAEAPIELEQGGWDMPDISQVDVSIKNATGFYQLNFAVEGTSVPGTERIEVTFGGLNGTEIEVADEMWFSEETNFQIFNNWILLQGTGNSTDEWSTWTFEINFAISSTNGLMGAIESLSNLPGLNFDLGNFSLEEFDMDAANVTQAIAEMKFYFIARSYNETGSWGQEARDITGQVQTALLGFLIDEGLIEGPSDDDDQEPPDDDTESEDEGKEISTGLIVGISLAGVVFMIAAISVGVVMVLRRSKKD